MFSKGDYLRESRHVGEAFDAVSQIVGASNSRELNDAKRKLDKAVKDARADGVSSRDLTTIEQSVSQGMYLSNWGDQQSGGRDELLQQRMSILGKAFDDLN